MPRISEVIPSMWAYRPYNGLTFDQAKQRLNTPFRVALAHGDVQQGRPRTGATAKDVGEVAGEVPVIRYMARTVLQNFREALDTPADINALSA